MTLSIFGLLAGEITLAAQIRFTSIEYQRFKAFERFNLHLRNFNILVGPNNAGKSTILTSFRILAAAMRKARTRSPIPIRGPNGNTYGYDISLEGISVAEENIFYNYDDSEPALVKFHQSNNHELTLFFPKQGVCFLLADGPSGTPQTPTAFKKNYDSQIGFVPILGPVEHREQLYREEAARLALYNYTAARNFRNIWHHYPQKFPEFQALLRETWPGIDIERPIIDTSFGKATLNMFCREERILREIFWAGFGFQVWCQMLTHIVQSSGRSIFLIDEPDIYLHADLQRQLLTILRNLDADVLIATHSTEIITEAEPDDIVLINKKRRSSRRIKQPTELADVFVALGSNLNPVLTQIAKTRRVIFVEGQDFQIFGKFAKKLGSKRVGMRADFAIVPVRGFSTERIKNLKEGMEATLGGKILAAAILDRDYRSQEECDTLLLACRHFCSVVEIHRRKEVENFLLSAEALDRAASNKLQDYNRRTGKTIQYEECAKVILTEQCAQLRNDVTAQQLAFRRRFDRKNCPTLDDATSNALTLAEFNAAWNDLEQSLKLLPGKQVLSNFNKKLQERFGISITPTAIIEAYKETEIPQDLVQLMKTLESFCKARPGQAESFAQVSER